MAVTLPPPAIQFGVRIADPDTGAADSYFLDWLNRQLVTITDAINANAAIVTSLQAQQAALIAQTQQVIAAAQAAQAAQAAADAAGGGTAKSGNAQSNVTSTNTSTWSHGPVVSLTGVSAGHLTIATSGPNQDNTTGVNAISGTLGDFTGNWRVVEVIGGVDTVVYNSGTYHGERDRDDQGIENILYNLSDVSAVSIARSTTGAMDYRLDINAPTFEATSVLCYLAVRRGA